MDKARKILLTAAATTWLLSSGSLVLFAKNKVKQLQNKGRITVGFQTGKSFSLLNTVNHKPRYSSVNSASVKAPISAHVKAEVSLSYNTLQNQLFTNKISLNNTTLRTQSVSFPLTVQYYPLKHKCKMQPYCGVGVQYSPSPFKTISSPGSADAQYSGGPQSGTNYISIFFAQGVTYEVNTRIQLTQSFHFIPESPNKSIGFGIGLGYNFQ
jgi:outer membrane protein W